VGFKVTSGMGRYALTAGLVAVAVVFSLTATRHRAPRPTVSMPAPPTVEAAEVAPYERAVALVEEERGAETGREAVVEVPAQLRHYADRKRFLALQVAEASRLKLRVPADYADLADLIRAGELVELSPYGETYVLYGVGLSAGDDPFTHYDERRRRRVPLFAGREALRAEQARLSEALAASEVELKAAGEELKAAPREDVTARKELSARLAGAKKKVEALKKERALLAESYDTDAAVRRYAAEYGRVAALAADFGGESYEMEAPASRREMKVRMLCFLRPAARDVLEEVGRAYRERFGRPLPVTSVVRTIEYQNLLSRTNANATRIETPPHSTGLAFDIYYRYMDADEQNFLMAELARLKDSGRIEVLRERRDHFHVFAFAGGRPPEEALVKKARAAASAEDEEAEAPRPSPRAAARAARPAKKAQARRASARKKRGG
jgi:hypothetical protein